MIQLRHQESAAARRRRARGPAGFFSSLLANLSANLSASLLLALLLLTAATAPSMGASRIKDLANVEGVRDNQLVGYGLVVGLNGTGDSLNNSPFTRQSLMAMLERLGVNTRGTNLRTANVAAVMKPAESTLQAAMTRARLSTGSSLLPGRARPEPRAGRGPPRTALRALCVAAPRRGGLR